MFNLKNKIMNFIIICFVCIALILAVIFFAKRHMQKVTQAYEQEQKDALVSVSDLERVAKGGKSSRTYDAERQRTRRLSVFFIAIIVIIGAAAAIFDSYKQELLEGWSSLKQSQKTEVSKTATQIPEFFNRRLYWDYEYALRYYEQKKISAYEKAETEHAKCQQAVAQAQSRVDKIIYEEKLAKAEEKLTSTKEALDKFDIFASDLNTVTVFQYWCYTLFAIGFLTAFYVLYRKEETCWVVFALLVLSIGIAVGIAFIIMDWVTRNFFSVVELTVLGLIISECILIAKCGKYTC